MFCKRGEHPSGVKRDLPQLLRRSKFGLPMRNVLKGCVSVGSLWMRERGSSSSEGRRSCRAWALQVRDTLQGEV